MPLGPVTGLLGAEGFTVQEPELTPAQRYGGPYDPRHGQVGEVAAPYPWQVMGFGDRIFAPSLTDYALVDDCGPESDTFAAGSIEQDPLGDYAQHVYGTHAAVWAANPAGDGSQSPDNVAVQLMQSAELHASDLNSSKVFTHSSEGYVQNDQWEQFYNNDAETPTLQQRVPQQVGIASGGYGSTDRVQSNAAQNSYGFQNSHLFRRWAKGSIPGNYMWMKPGSRPMTLTYKATRNFPTGVDSPFQGDNPAATFSTTGAILTQIPTEYDGPIQPATAAPFDPSEPGGSQDVIGEWW